MTNQERSTAVCQQCGGTRGPSRYCPHCGLDFWKAAEAAANPASEAEAEAPASATPAAGRSVAPIAIAAGVGLLLVAVVLWVVAGSGLFQDRVSSGPRFDANPPPAAHPLVLAFYREARDPDAAYEWRQSGSVTVVLPDEEVTSRISAVGRIVGNDWQAKMRIVDDGEATFDGEIAIVAERGYARTADDPWVETGRIPNAQVGPINPFARITTVGEMDYVGPETRDGVDGHVLTTDKWLSDPELDDPIRRIAHVRSRTALMEIFVTADGVPVSADYTFGLEARTPGGEIVRLEGAAHYVFSAWDEVDPIAAPSVGPAPSP